ncbi:aminodeoxychorismate synthase component I [Actinoplanes teichomyceticus]|uniref:aminodeoxychorismate synthase n=1 Tax=Actinoplanes teichomyceticus TaxID=1867 RepID=A0A561WBN7_ACTTI|nr:aminodeoxychorismate synthase component I [Actinoplanes teichomyceticus]TWG21271.1 para-aminobenzoate synthetase [Actinoplanes teichomyceticus]GIF16716.1 aminodeoxychorismate synthase, component I [Actinoplanes teichomyceticus]
MRTLLVDNYDSYTYNLFQLIAMVNGAEPVVVRHDDPTIADLDLTTFDNVVISPGPGRPDREHDFGFSARVIAEAPVPVLGVCLGHQGIAAGHGAEVVPAPEPRHGHLTSVTHDGTGLFAGVPQNFTAVRYHSLCVEQLPPDLEATAWAEDGVIMALRHRTRPMWGVQFHPESICTEHGVTLFTNFRELTLAHQARVRPARTAHRLHVRSLGWETDAESAFDRLYRDATHAFWLDSARVEEGLSRFSYLGDAAGPLSEVVRYDTGSGAVEVTTPTGETRREPGTIFTYLRRRLAEIEARHPDLPGDLACGYVGWFGYELKGDLGSPIVHRADTPDACWLLADRLIAVDHRDKVTYLVALSDGTAGGDTAAEEWLTATVERLLSVPEATPAEPLAAPPVDTTVLADALVRDREQYLADIASCKRELVAGESYEICLTNSVVLPRPRDGFAFYQAMRRYNPAPYAAYLRFGDIEVACSSPERFLRVTADRTVETKPIKGTAPRDPDPVIDEKLRAELTVSDKTRAENLMIVDLLRNDLGRVCEVGSVTVPKLMQTESYASVHQLVSTIRGRLRADADILGCVEACFPGGSMTGAPKLRTLEIIDGLETTARGVYSGSIGFLGCNGTADLNIVIRTAVLAGDRMRIGAGGAIILDSDPEGEFAEMLLKAAAPLRAVLAGQYQESADVRR